jgi:hypothetical protein
MEVFGNRIKVAGPSQIAVTAASARNQHRGNRRGYADARSVGPGLGAPAIQRPARPGRHRPRGVAGLYAPAPSVNPLQPHSE